MRQLTTEEWERFGLLALDKFRREAGPQPDLDEAAASLNTVGDGFLDELVNFSGAETVKDVMIAGNLLLLGYTMRDLVEQVDTEKLTI